MGSNLGTSKIPGIISVDDYCSFVCERSQSIAFSLVEDVSPIRMTLSL